MRPLFIRRKMRTVVTTRRRAALRLVTDLELPSSDLEELPDLAGVDDDDAQLTTVAHRPSGRCDRIEVDLDIEDSGERPSSKRRCASQSRLHDLGKPKGEGPGIAQRSRSRIPRSQT